MQQIDPADLFSDPVERSRISAEAAFGLNEIRDAFEALPVGARVLEVGCGTGFLLASLAGLRPDLSLFGLEPLGKGFAAFETTLARIEAAFGNLTIYRVGVEDFALPDGEEPFDMIFSINVFEHLDDWPRAVANTATLLAPGGRMIVLCPNYAVPYEPHFGIPIIGGPKWTRRLFARHIDKIEQKNNARGLWDSLNFITAPALRRECRRLGIDLAFDKGVMARMLMRLDSDAEFRNRQAAVTGVARLLRMFGVGALFQRLPAALSPYMKAIVKRPDATSGAMLQDAGGLPL
ncbi:methyltransferase domain-containing protein [Shinella zoogloeoides]